MREVPLSLSEYSFVLKALSESLVKKQFFFLNNFKFINMFLSKWKRLDKRGVYDARETDIQFFKTRGACIVSIGDTKYEFWSLNHL